MFSLAFMMFSKRVLLLLAILYANGNNEVGSCKHFFRLEIRGGVIPTYQLENSLC